MKIMIQSDVGYCHKTDRPPIRHSATRTAVPLEVTRSRIAIRVGYNVGMKRPRFSFRT